MGDGLRESILGLWGHPDLPTDVYLDLEEGVVRTCYGWDEVPREAKEGRWQWICRAPSCVVPESLVDNLLRVEHLLRADIESYRTGKEISGYYGEFYFQAYWEPEDWFGPFIPDLARYYRQGLTPEQVLEREVLETEAGLVEYESALLWLRELWNQWDRGGKT